MASDDQSPKERVDRWLWAVRLFKTRSLATEACKKNHVKVDEQLVKPSKEIKVGDIVCVKLGPLQKVVRVDGLIDKRVSAAVAAKLTTDLTTPQAYEKAKQDRLNLAPRIYFKKGSGRPTKKQRRDLDDFLYPDSPDE